MFNKSFIAYPDISNIIDIHNNSNDQCQYVHGPYKLSNNIIKYLNFTDNVTKISSDNTECGRIWLYHNKGLILSIDSVTNNTVYIKNISPYQHDCNASRISVYLTIHISYHHTCIIVTHSIPLPLGSPNIHG